VLLHSRVRALQEGPAIREAIKSVIAFSVSTVSARVLPCSSALLRSLAEKEAELLQSFREGVFGRHYVRERTIERTKVNAVEKNYPPRKREQWVSIGDIERERTDEGCCRAL
jgi:hypothetical protein